MNASLLVHEATDTWIPVEIDRSFRGDKKTCEFVTEKTIAKGHSTAVMAGAFARSINARQLVMNHFSAKYVFFRDFSFNAIDFSIVSTPGSHMHHLGIDKKL